jgi:hypothetical protein
MSLKMTIISDNWAAKEIVEAALVRKICEPFRGLVIKDGMNVSGAIIFNNYDQHDIHFTCVLSRPIGMRDARSVARYVFEQLGCRRCTAVTASSNYPARKALLQLGFRQEGILREHFELDDGVVYGMLRSEQKIVRMS